MPRNSGGTYSTPAGQPVVTGTSITSATFNALVSDLATETTDGLSRSGKGGMSAALQHSDGTVASPSLTYVSETNSGWFRNGAGDHRFSLLGTLLLKLTSALMTLTGAFVQSGAGTNTAGGTFAGNGSGVGVSATGGATGAGLSGTGGASAAGAVLTAGGGGSPVKGAVNLVPQAAPSAPADGDMWVETTINQLKARINSASVQVTPLAWALLTCGAAGAVTVTKGYNVASASYSGSNLTITFTTAPADANYAVTASTDVANQWLTRNGASCTTAHAVVTMRAVSAGSGVATNLVNGDIVSVMIRD